MNRSDVKSWHEDAVCRRETPDVPLWTSDSKPTKLVLAHLERMCASCPVRVRCATQALDDHAEGGTWAGVHLPTKLRQQRWRAAREQLQRIRDVVAEGASGASA